MDKYNVLTKVSPSLNKTIKPPTGVIPNKIFDTYWYFASERQRIFWKRYAGESGPWTKDPILQTYKFTNTYRVLDRVSQYLLKNVIYCPDADDYKAANTVFRIMLFKLFNRPETWELLTKELGDAPSIHNWDITKYDTILTSAQDRGKCIYSNAYMMTAAGSNGDRRHRMYLKLWDRMFFEDGLAVNIKKAPNFEAVYNLIRPYRTMGPFLAMQYAIDINYSEVTDFLETDFIVAGPGARRGILKCFDSIGNHKETDVIRWIQETQDEQFTSRGLIFKKIGQGPNPDCPLCQGLGSWVEGEPCGCIKSGRPLQLIDCQSLFCEVDKYTRASNPEVQVDTGSWDAQKRARIKQKFSENTERINYVFPPKWGITL